MRPLRLTGPQIEKICDFVGITINSTGTRRCTCSPSGQPCSAPQRTRCRQTKTRRRRVASPVGTSALTWRSGAGQHRHWRRLPAPLCPALSRPAEGRGLVFQRPRYPTLTALCRPRRPSSGTCAATSSPPAAICSCISSSSNQQAVRCSGWNKQIIPHAASSANPSSLDSADTSNEFGASYRAMYALFRGPSGQLNLREGTHPELTERCWQAGANVPSSPRGLEALHAPMIKATEPIVQVVSIRRAGPCLEDTTIVSAQRQ